jgi:MbtH protein
MTQTDRDEQDARLYVVVMNHEEQYSIWPSDSAIPAGWQAVGIPDSRDSCLDYIERVWTDMRPLSLRGSASGSGNVQTPPT